MIDWRLRWLLALVTVLVLVPAVTEADLIATFDDAHLTPPPTDYTGTGGGKYYNGSDGAGKFTSGGIEFTNNYNSTYGSWNGWSYSNTTDTTTAGYTNQYSAYTGGAAFGSQYGVYFRPFALTPTVSLPNDTNAIFKGAFITNTTYAALSMLNGDSYAKEFGGDEGTDPDWFKLTITGVDSGGTETGSLDFFLADYRFDNDNLDYIVDRWTWVDLSGLGEVNALKFDLTSSDVGSYGMNTPAYFAMDDLTAVPEPGTLLLSLIGVTVGLAALGIRRRCKRKAAGASSATSS